MTNEIPKEWEPFYDLVQKAKEQCASLRGVSASDIKSELVLVRFLAGVPEELKLAYRCALAVAKWYPNQVNPGGSDWPTCSFCVEYILHGPSSNFCNKDCPLMQIGDGCLKLNSTFDKWYRSDTYCDRKSANKWGGKMFRLLMNIYIREYTRLQKKGLV